jgi:hypothetical protein
MGPRSAHGDRPTTGAERAAYECVLEIHNHLRDLANYGLTTVGGRVQPYGPEDEKANTASLNHAWDKREKIQMYVRKLHGLRTQEALSAEERAHVDAYVRAYVAKSFSELNDVYRHLMYEFDPRKDVVGNDLFTDMETGRPGVLQRNKPK